MKLLTQALSPSSAKGGEHLKSGLTGKHILTSRGWKQLHLSGPTSGFSPPLVLEDKTQSTSRTSYLISLYLQKLNSEKSSKPWWC